MNKTKVIEDLQKKYPGKNIICLPEVDPKEIICEVDPKNGIAVAVIDESIPHYHNKITEIYRVIGGGWRAENIRRRRSLRTKK